MHHHRASERADTEHPSIHGHLPKASLELAERLQGAVSAARPGATCRRQKEEMYLPRRRCGAQVTPQGQLGQHFQRDKFFWRSIAVPSSRGELQSRRASIPAPRTSQDARGGPPLERRHTVVESTRSTFRNDDPRPNHSRREGPRLTTRSISTMAPARQRPRDAEICRLGAASLRYCSYCRS